MRQAFAVRMYPLFLALMLVTAGACQSDSGSLEQESSMRYARKFSLEKRGPFTLLEVRNPWQNSRGVQLRYVLGRDAASLPDSLSSLPFIQVPVQRSVVMSTTHLAMLKELGQLSTLVGLSGGEYAYDEEVREALSKGDVQEIGYGQGINYELLVSLRPDVVFFYGVEGSNSAVAQKLADLGVRVVFCAEYLEAHPLGKAEWLHFFAPFFGQEARAAAHLQRVDSAYMALKALAAGVDKRPRVLTGLPWKDTWYVAGGQSFAARFISDAGGEYLWAENDSREALPLDLESVYVRALEADIWINPGVASSLAELHAFDPRFSRLGVLLKGEVYNNNRRSLPGGGNDYWESATLWPDRVLADLIRIFHPQLQEEGSLYYYMKLK